MKRLKGKLSKAAWVRGLAVLIALLLFCGTVQAEGILSSSKTSDASGEVEEVLIVDDTKITDFSMDYMEAWGDDARGWRYDAESRMLILSGGQYGLSLKKIVCRGDLTIATAGVLSVEDFKVVGDLKIIGNSVLVIDSLKAVARSTATRQRFS